MRITKPETNPKEQISKSKMNAEMTVLSIRYLDFVLVSNFGFRVSDFRDRSS